MQHHSHIPGFSFIFFVWLLFFVCHVFLFLCCFVVALLTGTTQDVFNYVGVLVGATLTLP